MPVAVYVCNLEGRITDYTDRPVSRQHEAAYLGYFGYPYYWGGPYMWGPALYPSCVPMIPTAAASEALAERIQRESPDSHLRSADAVKGYRIEAADGVIGHVDGFVVDGWISNLRFSPKGDQIAFLNHPFWPDDRGSVAEG